MAAVSYNAGVFINCPFDFPYKPIFDAIIFTVYEAGLLPRPALETENSAAARIDKIYALISTCKYAIHDISRTELDSVSQLPRFNMPLELGIFLGCRRFGSAPHPKKVCLVLDREQHRYQKFISDISGQDIRYHENQPQQAVSRVRDWLQSCVKSRQLSGGAFMWGRYNLFRDDLPSLCDACKIREEEMTYNDLSKMIEVWREAHV